MVSKPKERTMLLEDRIAALELRVGRLERTSTPHEHWQAAPARPATVTPAPRAAAASVAPPTPKPAREPIALEDFLGGRVLAWLGAVAVIAGLALLVTVPLSRGGDGLARPGRRAARARRARP